MPTTVVGSRGKKKLLLGWSLRKKLSEYQSSKIFLEVRERGMVIQGLSQLDWVRLCACCENMITRMIIEFAII